MKSKDRKADRARRREAQEGNVSDDTEKSGEDSDEAKMNEQQKQAYKEKI